MMSSCWCLRFFCILVVRTSTVLVRQTVVGTCCSIFLGLYSMYHIFLPFLISAKIVKELHLLFLNLQQKLPTMTTERSNLFVTINNEASFGDTKTCPKERRSVWPVSGIVGVSTLILLPVVAVALISSASKKDTLIRDTKSLAAAKREKNKKSVNLCEKDYYYSKHTAKTAYELPFAALFHDNKGQKKFEASSITMVGNEVYAVCDSSWAISKFDSSLLPFSTGNIQIGEPDRDGDFESGYEAIFHHQGFFYVVRESVLHHHHDDDKVPNVEKDAIFKKSHSYHAIIEEIVLSDTGYTVMSECSSEFEFEGDSKGFEGAIGFSDAAGELYIIGLCEGNHCSEARKADAGNGRLVVMKKGEDESGKCKWMTYRIVKIPKSVFFIDYSDIDITDNGRIAISSQENSEVWIGKTIGISNGIIDPDHFGFDEEASSKSLQFPKNSECHTIYCNVEGIHWMNSEMLLAVSDKMKSRGRQDFRCLDKDQSIHAFVLP